MLLWPLRTLRITLSTAHIQRAYYSTEWVRSSLKGRSGAYEKSLGGLMGKITGHLALSVAIVAGRAFCPLNEVVLI